ncbi:MAG TPA: hypothetical protein VIK33_15450 [Anaerolineae bacterium]
MANQIIALRPAKRSERLALWLSRHWLLAFNRVFGAFVIAPWLAPIFMQIGLTGLGNALGSFNSWMRLLTGALFGLASVWLAFPYAQAGFVEVRETLEGRLPAAS